MRSAKGRVRVWWVILATAIVIIIIWGTKEWVRKAPEPETPTAVVSETTPTHTPTKTPTVADQIPTAEVAPTQVATSEDLLTTGPRLVVSGRVLLLDSSPATGAKIKLIRYGYKEKDYTEEIVRETTADEQGHYRLVAPDSLLVSLTASRQGCAELNISVRDEEALRRGGKQQGTREVTKDIVLPWAASINGQVVDEQDQPISGTTITGIAQEQRGPARNATRSKTATDERGRFAIDDLPPGQVLLIADSPDYVAASLTVTAPVENVIFQLSSEGAIVDGHVYLKSSGEGVAGATVRLRQHYSSRETETDERGAFRFQRLAAGKCIIDTWKEQLHQFLPKGEQFHRITLAEKEHRKGIALFLYEGHTIRGKVTDKVTGLPLDGVKVSTRSEAYSVLSTDITGDDGYYLLSGISPPHASLTLDKEGYILIQEKPYFFHPWVSVELNPEELEITKDLQMMRSVTISGTVEDTEGEPVSSGKVSLVTSSRPTKQFTPVDESGAFTLEAKPLTPCRVKAEAPGYATAFSENLDIQHTPIEGVTITLKSPASVTGTVSDPKEQPVEGAYVEVEAILFMGRGGGFGFKHGQSVTDSEGNFLLTGLPPEQLELTAKKEGYADSRTEKVTLSPGEEKSGVKLTLQASQFLAGRITNQDGEPIEGVQVDARSSASGYPGLGRAFTDADGRYRIENLPDTPHDITLHHQDCGWENYPDVQVGRDDADFVLTQKSKVTLIGNVVDGKTGEPIVDFNVKVPKAEKDPQVPGRFIAKNLASGTSYRVYIEAPGYLSLEKSVGVAPDKELIEETFNMGQGGTIVGRVVARASREPLAEVKVHLRGVGGSWALRDDLPEQISTTGQDGRFQFQRVMPGENTVAFVPPEPLVRQIKHIMVEHGTIADFGDVAIGSGGVIKGSVLQMPDEIPVPQASLLMISSGHGIKRTVTDENGAFEFKDLVNDTYQLYLSDYGLNEIVALAGDEIREIVFRIGPGVLRGRVLQAREPAPARIDIRQSSALQYRSSESTDERGNFEIKDLAPGRWKVTVSSARDWKHRMETWVDILPDKVTERTFELPTGRIVGRVVDAEDQPVAGATVSARRSRAADEEERYGPRTWATTTEQDGSFAIEGLSSGSYGVAATNEGLGIALAKEVRVPQDSDSEFVTLRLGATEGGTLISIVTNMATGEPMPRAWCRLATTDGRCFDHGQKRDEKGLLRIDNLPPETYQAQVGRWNFSTNEHTVEIKAGETVELKDQLYEAGQLRWTVLDKEGFPLAGVACVLEPLEPDSKEKTRKGHTDTNGLWIQEGLYPGQYKVTTTLPDGKKVSKTVLLKSGELTYKEIFIE